MLNTLNAMFNSTWYSSFAVGLIILPESLDGFLKKLGTVFYINYSVVLRTF